MGISGGAGNGGRTGEGLPVRCFGGRDGVPAHWRDLDAESFSDAGGGGIAGVFERSGRRRGGARLRAAAALIHVARCRHDFGGGDGLADVALGVVGDVDEQAADGCGQLLFADGARFVQASGINLGRCAWRQSARVASSSANSSRLVAPSARFHFERGELLGVEIFSFGVGQQAIHAARDVADVEGYGRDFRRPRVELFVAQAWRTSASGLPGRVRGRAGRLWAPREFPSTCRAAKARAVGNQIHGFASPQVRYPKSGAN